MCKCVRAPARAPPGEGPGGAAAGGGQAALLLPVSGLLGPRRGLPAAGALYLPAIFRGGRAPGPGLAAPGAPLFLPLALRFWLVAGGAVAPARSPGAIESGLPERALSGSACPESRRLGAGWVPARGDGRGCNVSGALPPAARHGAGLRGARGVLGAAAVVGLPGPPRSSPRGVPRATAAPAPSSRQDSLAPVVMVTAAPVNERLSDTRAPAQPDVAPGAPRSRLPLVLRGPRGAGGAVPGPELGSNIRQRLRLQGLGLFLSPTVELGPENKRNCTARTVSSLGARPGAR